MSRKGETSFAHSTKMLISNFWNPEPKMWCSFPQPERTQISSSTLVLSMTWGRKSCKIKRNNEFAQTQLKCFKRTRLTNFFALYKNISIPNLKLIWEKPFIQKYGSYQIERSHQNDGCLTSIVTKILLYCDWWAAIPNENIFLLW